LNVAGDSLDPLFGIDGGVIVWGFKFMEKDFKFAELVNHSNGGVRRSLFGVGILKVRLSERFADVVGWVAVAGEVVVDGNVEEVPTAVSVAVVEGFIKGLRDVIDVVRAGWLFRNIGEIVRFGGKVVGKFGGWG
jgi:hypothetical protein